MSVLNGSYFHEILVSNKIPRLQRIVKRFATVKNIATGSYALGISFPPVGIGCLTGTDGRGQGYSRSLAGAFASDCEHKFLYGQQFYTKIYFSRYSLFQSLGK